MLSFRINDYLDSVIQTFYRWFFAGFKHTMIVKRDVIFNKWLEIFAMLVHKVGHIQPVFKVASAMSL